MRVHFIGGGPKDGLSIEGDDYGLAPWTEIIELVEMPPDGGMVENPSKAIQARRHTYHRRAPGITPLHPRIRMGPAHLKLDAGRPNA